MALLVDENIMGPEIAYFAIKNFLHFDLSCRQTEKQEPKLTLLEFRFAFFSVLDLFNQEVRKILICDLNYKKCTVRVPVDPQKPLVEKLLDLGMSRYSGIPLAADNYCYIISLRSPSLLAY